MTLSNLAKKLEELNDKYIKIIKGMSENVQKIITDDSVTINGVAYVRSNELKLKIRSLTAVVVTKLTFTTKENK